MGLYEQRLESIMEREGCNADEAARLMELEFAHDEVPPTDPWEEIFAEPED